MSNRLKQSPVLLYSLLSDHNSAISSLFEHAKNIQHFESRLHEYLASPMNKHFKLANYSNSTLILHADSPTWAAKLRYSIPVILKYMQKDCQFNSLKTIRIKVVPAINQLGRATTRRLNISATSANFLNDVALSLADNELRASLLKIASHKN